MRRLLPESSPHATGDGGRIITFRPIHHAIRRAGVGVVREGDAGAHHIAEHRLNQNLVGQVHIAVTGDDLFHGRDQSGLIDIRYRQEGASERRLCTVLASATGTHDPRTARQLALDVLNAGALIQLPIRHGERQQWRDVRRGEPSLQTDQRAGLG